MGRNSIMIDLDDPRAMKIAEAMGNKTSKKILGLLSEDEMSASEISLKLKLPLNTIGYNMKKLVESGLVEKVKRVFWSSRGKKMEIYKISNKRIIIEPRRMIRGVIPAIVVSIGSALGIKYWFNSNIPHTRESILISESDKVVSDFATSGTNAVSSEALKISEPLESLIISDIWLWFLAGAFVALLTYLIWNSTVQNRRGFK